MKFILQVLLSIVLFLPTFANAVTNLNLIVIDDPACGHCQRFNAEIGHTGYENSEYGSQAIMSYVTAGTPPPAWFTRAYKEGRIRQIVGTPTFLFFVPDQTGLSIEVGRIVGYGGKDWWFERVERVLAFIKPHMRNGLFTYTGEQPYLDVSVEDVEKAKDKGKLSASLTLRIDPAI